MKKIISLIIYSCLIFCFSCKSDDSEVVTQQKSSFDVTAVMVTNTDGDAPKKGDEIILYITVKNTGSSQAAVVLSPKISSSRFGDYNKVSLNTVKKDLAADETAQVPLKVGPFIYNETNGKHYALGRGEYFVNSIGVNNEEDTDFEGAVFNIAKSNVVFVPVIYDPAYLDRVKTNMGIKEYLKTGFTRKVELFDNGKYIEYPNGMDEMMGIHQIFYPLVTDNVTDDQTEGGKCEKAVSLGGKTLGLLDDWKGPVGTQTNNHGFDYLLALTPDSFGGVTCGWLNVQVSGVFDFDLSLDRSQIVMIHETGHILGSPHCDPLQGYVMCSGEKHRKYTNQGIYVFNIASRNKMKNRFD